MCHRTEVAVRTQILEPCHWERYVRGNLPENTEQDSKAGAFINKRLLSAYNKEAEQALDILEARKAHLPAEAYDVLRRRWKQINPLVRQALSSMVNTNGLA